MVNILNIHPFWEYQRFKLDWVGLFVEYADIVTTFYSRQI